MSSQILHNPLHTDPIRGLVLSGGGARGAYEAGVLSYIFEELPETLLTPGCLRVLCGTSVGAIHACYLASTAHIPRHEIHRVVDLWRHLRIERLMRLGTLDLMTLPYELFSLFRGKPVHKGVILHSETLQKLVLREIEWSAIRRNLEARLLDGLTVSTTHIATGRTTVFIDRPHGGLPSWTRDARRVAVAAQMGPHHALASAAIPVLFPAIPIDGHYYCDGGFRQNTPLSPALRLGVNRALVIGLSHNYDDKPSSIPGAHAVNERHPGPLVMFGKVLNALLLDHLDYDLQRLEGLNSLLRDGVEAFGPAFVDRLNDTTTAVRGASYRHVDTLVIRPSQDVGQMAIQFLAQGHKRIRGVLGWFLNKMTEEELMGSSDLLSYLLFDGEWADALIALGRADAHAARDRLIAFFGP